MNSSPSINEVSAALAIAQGAFKPAIFNRQNPHFRSRYADLAALIDATREGLCANKLAVVQLVVDSPEGTVAVESVLLHASGQWIASTVVMPADKATPQGWGAAITYAKRYGYSALLCIAGEDDDDGNTATAAVVQRSVPTPTHSPPGAAARHPIGPPTAVVSAPSAENLSGGDSFEAIKRDLEATDVGASGRLSRLAISKRVIAGQKTGALTPEQVTSLRSIYEALEKGNAE